MKRKTKWVAVLILVTTMTVYGDLVHRYTFNNNCSDSVGDADATLMETGGDFAEYGSNGDYGGYLWLKNGWDQKADLSAGGAYVDLPDGILNDIRNDDGVTIEMFVETTDAHWWSGYFTFGCGDSNDGVGDTLTLVSYENDSAIVAWHQDAGYWGHRLNISKLDGFTHVALVIDNANNTIYCYVNGVLAGSTPKPPWEMPGLKAGDNAFNDTASYLGRYYDNNSMLNAKIHEFRVWSEPLSETQVQANYDSFPTLPGEIETYAMTNVKFTATPGKILGKDSFSFSGRFLDAEGLELGNQVDLEVGPWQVTLNSDDPNMRQLGQVENYIYSGSVGTGTLLMKLNLVKRTVALTAKNIDLGELASPVSVSIASGAFELTATIEAEQNIKFLKGYQDTLRMSRPTISFTNGRFTLRGYLAAENYQDIVLGAMMTLNGNPLAVIPVPGAGESFVHKGYAHSYKKNKATNPDGYISAALFNLDTGALTVQGTIPQELLNGLMSAVMGGTPVTVGLTLNNGTSDFFTASDTLDLGL